MKKIMTILLAAFFAISFTGVTTLMAQDEDEMMLKSGNPIQKDSKNMKTKAKASSSANANAKEEENNKEVKKDTKDKKDSSNQKGGPCCMGQK